MSVEQMHKIIEELDCAVNDLMWFSRKELSWSKARCSAYVTGNTLRKSKYNVVHTVASEKDGKMSETMIDHRNLPNPHLFEPLFCTHA